MGTKLVDINLYIKNNNLENFTQVIEGVKTLYHIIKKVNYMYQHHFMRGFQMR